MFNVIGTIGFWLGITILRGCPVSINDVHSQGGLSSADILRTRGFLTFWRKKLWIFRNLWCVRTDKEVEPVRTFFGQGGRGSILRDFVRTSFMDVP